MTRGLVLVVTLAACGRLDFDARSPAAFDAADAAGDTGAALLCVQWNPFGAPIDVGLQGASAHWLGSITTDQLSIFFVDYTAANSNDLWLATRSSPTGTFAPDVRIGNLSTTADEVNPQTRDGLVVIYSNNASGRFQLMMATRTSLGGTFGSPVAMTDLATTANDFPGWLSDDQLRIYFSSDRSGNGAIYMAERSTPTSLFGPATRLAELDSPAQDNHPVLTADEREVFFSSLRGGTTYDVYHARRASRDVAFDPPTPVSELDTPNDDCYPTVSADGTQLYVNYNTLTGGGLPSDIWVATRTCAAYQ